MFRLVLQEHLALCRLRQKIEEEAVTKLAAHQDYQRLQTVPGIGPVLALVILAEAGDLRRFRHYRQFLSRPSGSEPQGSLDGWPTGDSLPKGGKGGRVPNRRA